MVGLLTNCMRIGGHIVETANGTMDCSTTPISTVSQQAWLFGLDTTTIVLILIFIASYFILSKKSEGK